MKKVFISLFLLMTSMHFAFSQCVMCKATVESAENNSLASGLNAGILYLMIVPYLLLSVIGYLWYKHVKKLKNERNK